MEESMSKCCICCKKYTTICNEEITYRCRVWGGLYKSEVVDLLFFEEKEWKRGFIEKENKWLYVIITKKIVKIVNIIYYGK